MNWNCTWTEERLSDVLDRTLSPEESATFQAHTTQCERCARLVAQVGGIVSGLQQLPWVDEPPFLSSKIIARTREMPRSAWSPAMWQTRLAMGIVTVAATFLIVLHAVGVGTPEKFQLSPANLYRDVNRRVHLTYARGVRLVNDLRVVYEIESRLSSQPAPGPRPDSQVRPKLETAPAADQALRREWAGLETPRSIP
jgi:anti-sigma factor RsiW